MAATGSRSARTASTYIQFELGRRQYRFGVERPTEDDVVVRIPTHHKLYAGTMANAIDAEWRRRWRARVLWLKATLEFAVDDGEVPTALAGFPGPPGRRTWAGHHHGGTLPMRWVRADDHPHRLRHPGARHVRGH
ncbi:MAG: hypothetical protein U0667_15415 [Chloroflexota bacterium]